MKYRKLRIAWSVAWGIGCLLLIALWVRSYHNPDVGPFFSHTWRDVAWGSQPGLVAFYTPAMPTDAYYRALLGLDVTGASPPIPRSRQFQLLGIHLIWSSWSNWRLWVPFWFLTLLPGALAGAPWIKWFRRFSLRTLLISMTLVAVGLGLAV